MHRRLEAYLSETEMRLRSLPGDQRESDIAELRQHLESIAAAYIELDYTKDEAVRCAIEQFGSARTVTTNLKSSYRRGNRRQVGSRILFTGWGLFLLSMTMPVLGFFGHTMRGAECALTVLSPFGTGPLSAACYYHALGVANIVVLLSPVLLSILKSKRSLWCLTIVVALATGAIAPLLSDSPWQIGFYAWWTSFGLVAPGSLVRALRFPGRSSYKGVIKAI